MSASIARNAPRNPDEPVSGASNAPEHDPKPAWRRKRVLFTALAVVVIGGLIAGPVSAAHRAEVRATIHGEVQPILVETALRRQRALATFAAADADQAVISVVPESMSSRIMVRTSSSSRPSGRYSPRTSA